MKKLLLIIAVLTCLTTITAQAQTTSVGYGVFYNELQPYGSWVDYQHYGYVWVPNAEPGFRPYETNGHWVATQEGWAWVSDYNWGWAPFHYGRWLNDPAYGWMWVPGNEWAPAWVVWGQRSNYYGWAPLAPGITFSMVRSNGWNPPPHYWTFVPHNYMMHPHINRYVVHHTTVNNVTIINNYNTTNNYQRGPEYKQVQVYTKRPVKMVELTESSKPGRATVAHNKVEIYRPNVVAGEKKEKPTQVKTVGELRATPPKSEVKGQHVQMGKPRPTDNPASATTKPVAPPEVKPAIQSKPALPKTAEIEKSPVAPPVKKEDDVQEIPKPATPVVIKSPSMSAQPVAPKPVKQSQPPILPKPQPHSAPITPKITQNPRAQPRPISHHAAQVHGNAQPRKQHRK